MKYDMTGRQAARHHSQPIPAVFIDKRHQTQYNIRNIIGEVCGNRENEGEA